MKEAISEGGGASASPPIMQKTAERKLQSLSPNTLTVENPNQAGE